MQSLALLFGENIIRRAGAVVGVKGANSRTICCARHPKKSPGHVIAAKCSTFHFKLLAPNGGRTHYIGATDFPPLLTRPVLSPAAGVPCL
eukprot:scaffold54344_cov87-Phaeocystis_antarctica.AAC.2